MKNELQTTNEQVDNTMLVNFLNVMGLTPKLTEGEQEQFINISRMYGLNPFKREIYCTVYGEGQYKQFSIITGYEVYIKRAERSGQLNGWHAITSGSVATNDLKATVTIHRKDREHPFIWEAYYDECVQTKKDGTVTAFWKKANFMTKKVAISQAFRLCFSDELGGMPYTSDELPQQTEDVTHEVVGNTPLQVEEAKPIPALTKGQFDKLIKDAVIANIEKALNGIEECLITATPAQVIGLEDLLTELRNKANE
jgi:phage recombination protein Bet